MGCAAAAICAATNACLQLSRRAAGNHDLAKLVQYVHAVTVEGAAQVHHESADTIDGFPDAGFVGRIRLREGIAEIELARMA